MKTFRVILCAMFVLCCGALFSACGTKDFNEKNINIGEHIFTYDGKAHMVDVEYKGVKAKVTYALAEDKKDFKTAEELNLVNAGTYNLYYRLSAKGYETYTSNGTLELTIEQKDLFVTIKDYNLIKSKDQAYDYTFQKTEIVDGDILKQQVVINDGFDKDNLNYGDKFSMGFSIQNPNYKVILTRNAVLTVTDYITIDKADGTTLYFGNLQDAIDAAEENDVLKLNDNVYLDEGIEVTKSITIDGRLKAKLNPDDENEIPEPRYSIFAKTDSFESTEYEGKTLTSLLYVTDSSVELTLKNVVLDGSQVARGVSVFKGKLNIDNATITNGKKMDMWHSGGVYVAKDASFVMKNNAKICRNDLNNSEYTEFGADLWISSNTNGNSALIEGGQVDNIFVNASSEEGAGKLTLDGGYAHYVYVAYAGENGAIFEFVSGGVEFLKVSATSPSGNYVQLAPKVGTQYIGGKLNY